MRFAWLVFVALLLPVPQPAHSQQTGGQTLALIPQPREIKAGGMLPLANGVAIRCATCTPGTEDGDTQADLLKALATRGLPAEASPSTPVIALIRSESLPDAMKAEGYLIATDGTTLSVTAASAAGLFYGVQTVKQLLVGDGSSTVLHTATIRDWPAMRYRGMHDDLARGPVPTLAFQKQLIRTLAAYKMNVYSPYFEHTQQYAANPLFAPPGGSMSAADARELVAYAARYHVIVIPEQEAFGHLHHNLTWEAYQPLAETPHGAVLTPTQPGSLALIQSMFGELAALYPGPFLHIGADETVDLGLGQTETLVDDRGLGPVYLDFLQRIQTALKPLGRRLLFWGDIARESPGLLKDLPPAFRAGTVAVAWEYNPQPTRGFARFLEPFTQAGFETWVASGVNNWSRVWPDANDSLLNIQGFVAEGQRRHATGMLNTVWYDDGEGLPNANWYGLLFGAAASWQPGESSIERYQQSFGAAFHGDQTGALDQAQRELMLCHALLRGQAKVGDGSDGLFWSDPWSRDGQTVAAKLRPFTHDLRTHAERALVLIAQARAAAPAIHSSSFAEAVGSALPLSSRNTPPSSARGAAEGFASPDEVAPAYDPASAFPSNPSSLRHPDAIDALELGARRLDFIGLKFQLADEIAAGYTRAQADAASTDKKQHAMTGRELTDINGINGRVQDIRDTYALLRELYQQAWLRTNRPYALRPILGHYDSAIALWQSRADRFRAAQRQYGDTKTLPGLTEVGVPPAPVVPR